MYFLDGFPAIYKLLPSCHPKEIKLSDNKQFLCILSLTSIHIHHLEPFIELYSTHIDQDFVNLYGSFKFLLWHKTSNIIAISTALGHLCFYSVETDSTVSNEYIVKNKEKSLAGIGHGYGSPMIPQVIITKLSDNLTFKSEISCLSHYFNQLLVTTNDGMMSFYEWPKSRVIINNPVYKFHISDIIGGKEKATQNLHITCITHSWILSAFVLILSDGRCGYIPHSSKQFSKENLKINFAPHIKNGVTCCFNDRFRLITFGTSTGHHLSYTHDETTNSLKLVLDSRKMPTFMDGANLNNPYNLPDQDETLGDLINKGESVSLLCPTADGMALGIVKRNRWTLESVYGHPLIEMPADLEHLRTRLEYDQVEYLSGDWGDECYSLWVLVECRSLQNLKPASCLLLKYDLIKSATSANSSFSSNHRHLLVQGSTSVYLGLPLYPVAAKYHERISSLERGDSSESRYHQSVGTLDCFFENREFTEIQIPTMYANHNKPIRISAIDKSGQGIVVAGRRGFLHYNILTRRWKLFGNETQENEFAVYGGLVWWREFILLSCLNLEQDMYELRAYPQSCRLDNSNMATRLQLPNQISVYQLDVYRDYLAAFFSNLTISLYLLATQSQVGKSTDSPTLSLTNVYTMDVSSLSVHPFCVVAFSLTFFSADSGADGFDPGSNVADSQAIRHVNSFSPNLVINVAGDLILLELQKKRSSSFNGSDIISSKDSGPATDVISTGDDSGDGAPHKEQDGYSVSLVSSGVENFWVHDLKGNTFGKINEELLTHSNKFKPNTPNANVNPAPPYLLDTMWIFRGSEGFKLWLPLPRPSGFSLPKYDLFSKRIIINFPVNLYPLAIHFSGAIVEGVNQGVTQDRTLDYLTIGAGGAVKRAIIDSLIGRQKISVTRSIQYILPEILRELIDKNLSLQALDVAEFYRQKCDGARDTLPIFLETLLHRVVEMDQSGRQKENPSSNSASSNVNSPSPSTPLTTPPSETHQLLPHHKKSKNLSTPDPLLPRVLAFLREFPEYFQILTGCARKSEIALWPRLFMYAGSEPVQLFRESISKGDLQTATFFLIVLQNLEPFSKSRHDVETLLRTTLEREQWHLSHEIVRYLSSIGVEEKESNSPSSGGAPQSAKPDVVSGSRGKEAIDKRFSYPLVKTLSSGGKPLDRRKDNSLDVDHTSTNECPLCTGNREVLPEPTRNDSSLYHVDQFLDQYASQLLLSEEWKRLGTFAANMSFPLVQWLAKQKNDNAKVKHYVDSFKNLHSVFEWPYAYAIYVHPKASVEDKSVSRQKQPVPNYTPLKVSAQLPLSNLTPTNSLLSTSDVNLAKLLEPSRISGPALALKGKDRSPPSVCDTVAYITNSPDKDLKVWHLPAFQPSSSVTNSVNGETCSVPQRPSTLNIAPLPKPFLIKAGSKDGQELQMRFLLKIFMESGCLDRALLMCIMLNDTESTPRIIANWLKEIVDQHAVSDRSKQPWQCPNLENVTNIAHGLRDLLTWSEFECPDYQYSIYQCLNPIVEIFDGSASQAISVLHNEITENVSKLDSTKMPINFMTINQQGGDSEKNRLNTQSYNDIGTQAINPRIKEHKELKIENEVQSSCVIN